MATARLELAGAALAWMARLSRHRGRVPVPVATAPFSEVAEAGHGPPRPQAGLRFGVVVEERPPRPRAPPPEARPFSADREELLRASPTPTVVRGPFQEAAGPEVQGTPLPHQYPPPVSVEPVGLATSV